MLAAASAAAAVLCSVAGAADPGKEKIRFDAADQAAARAAVLGRSELGPGWSGGRRKPDLSPAPNCPNYHAKQSDLVLTGAAESEFRRDGFDVDSEVQVLRTAGMVTLDWRRSVITPGAFPCLRRLVAKARGRAPRSSRSGSSPSRSSRGTRPPSAA